MADLKQLAEELVNLTVKEVNELAGILKDEYGIEPAAAAVAVAGPAAGGGEEAAAEQTEFDVVIKAAGQSNAVGWNVGGDTTQDTDVEIYDNATNTYKVAVIGTNPFNTVNPYLVKGVR